MNVQRLLIVISLVLLAAAPLAIAANRHAAARSRLAVAKRVYAQAARDVQELSQLRARQQVVSASKPPTQNVIAQVNTTLAVIGLPANRLKSLTPESDSLITTAAAAASGPMYKRQTLRLALESLSPSELGAFLVTWRETQQVWSPARIELAHVRPSSPKSDNLNQFDVTIVLSAVYVAQR